MKKRAHARFFILCAERDALASRGRGLEYLGDVFEGEAEQKPPTCTVPVRESPLLHTMGDQSSTQNANTPFIDSYLCSGSVNVDQKALWAFCVHTERENR